MTDVNGGNQSPAKPSTTLEPGDGLRFAAGLVAAVFYFLGRGMRGEVDDPVAVWIGNAFVALAAIVVFLVWFILARSRLRRPVKYSNRSIVVTLVIASAWVLWGGFALLFTTYNDPTTGAIVKELLERRYGNPLLPVSGPSSSVLPGSPPQLLLPLAPDGLFRLQ